MASLEIGIVAAIGFGGFALFYLSWLVASRRRRRAAPPAAPAPAPAAAPAVPVDLQARRLEQRLETLEESQAELAERLTSGDGEARLKEMAASLVALIRDKNATLETALAGLDQLRSRLKTLEQIGDLAEARGLFERLVARIESLESAEARIAQSAPQGNPYAEISEQLTRLYAQKDATVETVFARLGPLEAKLAEVDARLAGLDPRAALDRFAERLEALQARLEAGLAAPAENPFMEISEQLTRLYAQKDATVETVFARLAPLEARLATLEAGAGAALSEADLAAAERRIEAQFDSRMDTRIAPRIEALQDRIAGLEAVDLDPLTDLAGRLTALQDRRDAALDALAGRFAPIETRLGEIEESLTDLGAARNGIARLGEEIATLQAGETALRAEIARMAEGVETRAMDRLGERLAGLHARKEAAIEAVFARLGPLEAKLAELDGRLAGLDAQTLLDRFAERLEAARAALQGQIDALQAAGEAPAENPFAAISEQLTRLYAQKDATVETVFARLAPLEARLVELEGTLAARDPQAALDRFAERLEALQTRLETGLAAPAENPFTEISEQLTRLYAQKDATVETVFARLAPLEAKLAEIEGRMAGLDPQAALDRFAERLEAARAALQGQIDAVQATVESAGETPAENPFAEISEQLTRLYAQKDATVETVFARLGPLEARLVEMEGTLAARDPQAVLARLDERLAALQARVAGFESDLGAAIEQGVEQGLEREIERRTAAPLADLAGRIAELQAQRDAAFETLAARLGPLETALAGIEGRLAGIDPQAALDRFAERLETGRAALQGQIDVLRTTVEIAGEVPAENPFAEISEQLTRLYAQKDATVETVFARLGPLEAKLAEVEGRMTGLDPQAALDRFAERLEAARAALQGQIDAVQAAVESAGEVPAENPFAEISEQLTRLYAQKDATVEAVFTRLAPVEAKLSEIETRMGTLDPAGPVDRLAARLEELRGALQAEIAALQDPGETRFAELLARVAALGAEKEAILTALAERMAPLEAKLAEIESRGLSEDEARAEAQAVALQMIAAKTVAEETQLFANRLTLLEASLPRLSLAQSLMMQALERQAAPWPAGGEAPQAAGPEAAQARVVPPVAPSVPPSVPSRVPRTAIEPDPATVVPAPGKAAPDTAPHASPDAYTEEEELWQLPRVVSLHQSGQ